ncbi:Pup--protein ligase [Corynebacterium sp. sy017]|uniref:Pup--protein ligase n=1 Tax=unclassified Corynebacterium TaxID=2624378 RepID=UPI0011846C5E|nr:MULTISPECIES: Pup--protein ligase [unclassified Corynebacterium]MBP3087607.1 Pup--protein ligase [Corynebacterium sp. sy017]TSD92716.1 Pup--protein ligase [Corynebacterium sp. SY003]
MGLETEYGITCVSDGAQQLSADEVARYMFRPVIERWGSSNIYHPNASRLYLDVGSHPEIATAECDSIDQLIAYDRAGDLIVDELARETEKTLALQGKTARVFLFKNNLDSQGNSYGCHENYLISRDAVIKTLAKKFLGFLVTRQLIVGAGSIKNGQFRLSQRADHVWEGISSATTRSRPIINTRDEPHADSSRFRRLHVIVGDSSMSEVTTALKIGTTLLVLEMIEADFELADVELGESIAVIRDIAADPTGNTPVQLADGTTCSALELQTRYLRAAQRWLNHRQESYPGTSNVDMQRIVGLWEKVLNAMSKEDYAALEKDVDWAIKLSLLRSYQQRLGLAPHDFSHPKLAQIDLAYHDIRPGRGLFKLLEHKGIAHRWLESEQVMYAYNHAPQTTRAHLRGQFLSAAQKYNAEFSVDWLRLKVNRPEPQVVELADPFANSDTRVDDLIAYMQMHDQPESQSS